MSHSRMLTARRKKQKVKKHLATLAKRAKKLRRQKLSIAGVLR